MLIFSYNANTVCIFLSYINDRNRKDRYIYMLCYSINKLNSVLLLMLNCTLNCSNVFTMCTVFKCKTTDTETFHAFRIITDTLKQLYKYGSTLEIPWSSEDDDIVNMLLRFKKKRKICRHCLRRKRSKKCKKKYITCIVLCICKYVIYIVVMYIRRFETLKK